MTVVFAQGMRRSGTTILFDLFWDDPRFTCWYEPLNKARTAQGGGSRAREKVDYMADVVAFRERFLAARGETDLGQDALNWGAPRAPALEFDEHWPAHVRDFVAQMAAQPGDQFLKFTRASHKVADLAVIAPGAFLVHVVRDPRAVATSHVFRRAPEIRARILAEGSFFTGTTDFDQWKAEQMAAWLCAHREEFAPFAEAPAFLRVMVVWKELYRRTQADARRHFPDRHLLVSHEALCADPIGVLTRLHAAWGGRVPWKVRRWARKNVRPARPWHDPGNPAWDEAVERLALAPLLAEIEATALR